MKTYAVSLYLAHSQHDRANLWDSLRKLGAEQTLPSQWLLMSRQPLPAIRDTIARELTEQDRLIVIEVQDCLQFGAWLTLTPTADIRG